MKTYKFNLNTRNFGRIGSMFEFYEKAGLDFRGKDIRNFRINPITNKQVQALLIRTHRNYYYQISMKRDGRLIIKLSPQFLKENYAERTARFDWANYSPMDDKSLPLSVLVEYEPGDEEYVESRT